MHKSLFLSINLSINGYNDFFKNCAKDVREGGGSLNLIIKLSTSPVIEV